MQRFFDFRVPFLTHSIVIWLVAMVSLSVHAQTTQTESRSDEFSEFSQAELDQLLAPIALYPDSVLSHVLIASTYPLEVVLASRWLDDNPGLKGEDAINAVDEEWDPSVIALVAFPELLDRMSKDLSWTERLGDAFLADEARVLDSVQVLRRRAFDEGNLDDSEHTRVVTEERRIIIEPRVREVVYLPYYDTRVVYGSWWWTTHPPIHWYFPRPHHYAHARHVYWGPRVHLSFSFFFSSFHWSQHRLVVVDRHHWHHRPHYTRRTVIDHRHARTWRHEVRHRRGVTYRHHRVAERYSPPRHRLRSDKAPHSREQRSVYQPSIERHADVTRRLKNERKISGRDSDSGHRSLNKPRGELNKGRESKSRDDLRGHQSSHELKGERSGRPSKVMPYGRQERSRESKPSRGDSSILRGTPAGRGQTLEQRRGGFSGNSVERGSTTRNAGTRSAQRQGGGQRRAESQSRRVER
ncbi:DUF3300 domain-containing protein [Aurantivibrio plasticivorans]